MKSKGFDQIPLFRTMSRPPSISDPPTPPPSLKVLVDHRFPDLIPLRIGLDERGARSHLHEPEIIDVLGRRSSQHHHFLGQLYDNAVVPSHPKDGREIDPQRASPTPVVNLN
ncbi:hypothetical protein CCMA1212_000609 [Trichoderma ghanense]|uniref:Uncharacterized protein n=1 Tax=Trichoderma ghanense TaxID=65468 RepID=A0ABY2HIS2_9HYPO